VALGGNPDGSGLVAQRVIREVLKNEFEIVLDGHMLGEDESAGLGFTQFVDMFEQELNQSMLS
jgi:hypothetical protein